MAGVDLEPNHASEKLQNITFANCTFRNNSGGGVQIFSNKLNASSTPVSITFDRCLLEGPGRQLFDFPLVPDGHPIFHQNPSPWTTLLPQLTHSAPV